MGVFEMTFKKGYIPWNKGKKCPNMSGKNNSFYGKKHTEETKRKMRMVAKNRPTISEDTRKKLSKANKGRKHSEESKRKISEVNKGHFTSEETRRKIGEANRGYVPWNKNKTGVFSKEALKKMSEAQKGKPSGMKGKRHTKESKRKMSKSLKGKIPWIKGKRHTKEARKKLSETFKERFINKENHPSWRGGLSFEPYGLEFNNKLKEQIRKRDSYRCQQCFRSQDELYRNTKAGMRKEKLAVHHIDYQKTNNNPNNLISLCRNCHAQTNYKRHDWTEYFQNRIKNG